MSFSHRTVVLAPGEGPRVGVPGHPFEVKAGTEATGGSYALIEATITGEGPPQHVHGAEEEAFYVLEGQINVLVGDHVVHGEPGSFVLIPRGTIHTFWNAGTVPARMLVIVSPPGVEKFLAEVVGDEEIDTATFGERVSARAADIDMTVVGPPLG
jgi:mannose-6-phosphate isomerase-like protein (cupin superfamily)